MNSERSFKEKYGRWALVTGASSGIGAEFARQLAKHGLNVAVTARRKSRLESLVEELQETHGIRARALAAAGLRALGHKSMLVPGGINKKMVTMMTRFMPRQMALSIFGSMMSKTMDPSLL